MISPVQQTLPGLTSPRSRTVQEARAEIDRVERSIQEFDQGAARRKAGLTIAATTLTCGALGQLAGRLLPPGAALGVAATVSVGVAAVGMWAVNEIMHGVRDKSALGGCAVMAFFMGFAGAGAMQTVHPLLAAGVPMGIAALSGWGFGSSCETIHHGVAGRIQEARGLLDKYEAFMAQHAQVAAELSAPASPPGSAAQPA